MPRLEPFTAREVVNIFFRMASQLNPKTEGQFRRFYRERWNSNFRKV